MAAEKTIVKTSEAGLNSSVLESIVKAPHERKCLIYFTEEFHRFLTAVQGTRSQQRGKFIQEKLTHAMANRGKDHHFLTPLLSWSQSKETSFADLNGLLGLPMKCSIALLQIVVPCREECVYKAHVYLSAEIGLGRPLTCTMDKTVGIKHELS